MVYSTSLAILNRNNDSVQLASYECQLAAVSCIILYTMRMKGYILNITYTLVEYRPDDVFNDRD